jgi:hypothetical protein
VQARDVSGGLHIHASPGESDNPRVVPRQLPADVSVFVDRQSELRALTRLTGTRSESSASTLVAKDAEIRAERFRTLRPYRHAV